MSKIFTDEKGNEYEEDTEVYNYQQHGRLFIKPVVKEDKQAYALSLNGENGNIHMIAIPLLTKQQVEASKTTLETIMRFMGEDNNRWFIARAKEIQEDYKL